MESLRDDDKGAGKNHTILDSIFVVRVSTGFFHFAVIFSSSLHRMALFVRMENHKFRFCLFFSLFILSLISIQFSCHVILSHYFVINQILIVVFFLVGLFSRFRVK